MEEKNKLHKYAMQFGTAMGFFWILKFILFALGPKLPVLFVAFSLLTLAVPFLGYYFVRSYRNKVCGGVISFSQAWIFTLFMYMYAALLTAVAHYIYFQFIGTDSLMLYYTEQVINPLMTSGNADQITVGEQLTKIIQTFQQADIPAIKITMQFVSQNIFYCSIIAIPTALAVKKNIIFRHPTSTDDAPTNH